MLKRKPKNHGWTYGQSKLYMEQMFIDNKIESETFREMDRRTLMISFAITKQ